MARNESVREDLIREATAFARRAELTIAGCPEAVTVGIRSNGAFSVFFGQDPVYHFDAEGRLRRAFVDGLLYRSQHTHLASLTRTRTAEQTLLLRQDLNAEQQQAFQSEMIRRLDVLQQAIAAGHVSLNRSVAINDGFLPELTTAFAGVSRRPTDWLSQAIRTRSD